VNLSQSSKKILFRVDSSDVIGGGHMWRCLRLARSLRADNCEIKFVCREHDGHLIRLVEGDGFPVLKLPPPPSGAVQPGDPSTWLGVPLDLEIKEMISIVNAGRFDLVVLDHYAVNFEYTAKLRSAVNKIVVIDDLANRPLNCDIVLNQNLGFDPELYDGLVPSTCARLVGPRFTIFDEHVLNLGRSAVGRNAPYRNALVFFGTHDRAGATLEICRRLTELNAPFENVTVVASAAAKGRSELVELVSKQRTWQLIESVPSLGDLISANDVGFGACGSSQWERSLLGLPTLLWTVASNQEKVAAYLGDNGLAINMGSFFDSGHAKLPDIRSSSEIATRLSEISKNGMRLFDGKSNERIVTAIQELK
jgi:UDP-2,4-diacetamido-2,4,6-trideoxy-beta-L-altropyranose hydrolase